MKNLGPRYCPPWQSSVAQWVDREMYCDSSKPYLSSDHHSRQSTPNCWYRSSHREIGTARLSLRSVFGVGAGWQYSFISDQVDESAMHIRSYGLFHALALFNRQLESFIAENVLSVSTITKVTDYALISGYFYKYPTALLQNPSELRPLAVGFSDVRHCK